MISNLTYSQYPVVKKIGNDSVVLLTLKQGNEINKQFENNKKSMFLLSDTIKTLRMDISKFKEINHDLQVQNFKFRHVSDSFQYMYIENKKLYLEREKLYVSERKHFAITGTILIFLTILMSYL